MKKPIAISFTEEAKSFVIQQTPDVQKKFLTAFGKTKEGFHGDWFTKMTNTENIWEFRVDGPNHTYRLFAFWDSRGETQTLIVCTHGLDKKTQKTPKAEIIKAERIRREYLS